MDIGPGQFFPTTLMVDRRLSLIGVARPCASDANDFTSRKVGCYYEIYSLYYMVGALNVIVYLFTVECVLLHYS